MDNTCPFRSWFTSLEPEQTNLLLIFLVTLHWFPSRTIYSLLNPHHRIRAHQNWTKVWTPWCMILNNMKYHQNYHHTIIIIMQTSQQLIIFTINNKQHQNTSKKWLNNTIIITQPQKSEPTLDFIQLSKRCSFWQSDGLPVTKWPSSAAHTISLVTPMMLVPQNWA